jgi:thymidine phosphorylase
MAEFAPNLDSARKEARRLIGSGAAADKLRQLIAAQGGDARVVDNPDILPRAALKDDFEAPQSGYVTALQAETLGRAAMVLGAGRLRKDDPIDHAVGLVLHKRLGDFVEKGEPILTFHANDANKLPAARGLAEEALSLSDKAPAERPLIQEVVA